MATAVFEPTDVELISLLPKLRRDAIQDAKDENFKATYYADPLQFVLDEWPWMQPGSPLEHMAGPDDYQEAFLTSLGQHVRDRAFDGHTPVRPIMMSISSCVGAGKSTLGAWIAWWILRTRPMSVGTVTAGTFQQLEERTWADIQWWGRLGRASEDYDIQQSGIFNREHRDKWKVTPKTADANRAQSFAGQHAATSTSWLLLDEAASVPEPNWQAAYGCLSDGEPMMFAFGQMLRNQGEFYNVTFGDKSSLWDTRVFDGRYSRFTNKQTIKEWAEEWGEDSDFYRVRVLGLPPRASELQFISQDLVDGARKRTHKPLPDEPLVVGFDAANGGLAKYAFVFRRGLDAKTIPPIYLPGDTPRDQVVAKAADILSDRTIAKRVSAMFGDQAFGAVIMERLRNSGFTNVFEVNFGDPSLDKHYGNMRAKMWGDMREFLSTGAIPDDEKFAQGLMGPGFKHRPNGGIVLESKQEMAKRGVRSPDGPDALALSFARKVAPLPMPKPTTGHLARNSGSMGWAR